MPLLHSDPFKAFVLYQDSTVEDANWVLHSLLWVDQIGTPFISRIPLHSVPASHRSKLDL